MQIEFSVQIWREGAQFVAHAMPLDVASAGGTADQARQALDEAVQLFLKTAADHGTLNETLEDAGYLFDDGRWSSPEWVTVERHSAAVVA